MTRIEIQLPPAEAEVVWEAITAATEPGAHRESGLEAESEARTTSTSRGTPARAGVIDIESSRADAVVAIAEDWLRTRAQVDRSRDAMASAPKWNGDLLYLRDVMSDLPE